MGVNTCTEQLFDSIDILFLQICIKQGTMNAIMQQCVINF